MSDRPARRRGRPWTRRRIVVAVVTAGLLGALLATLGRPAGVGQFASAEARATYVEAYDRAMAELPTPDRAADVRTSFGVVRLYRFAGPHPDREPIVLLPGRSSGVPTWEVNLASLVAERPVYALDLLGDAGLSVQEVPITDAADAARWIHEVLLTLPEERLHLVGLSIGGWNTANLALRHPDKVASISLVEPIMVVAPISGRLILASIPASVPVLPESLRNRFLSWISGDVEVEPGLPVGDLIAAGLRGYRSRLPGPTMIEPEQLTGLRPPALVIVGGASRVHDPVAAEQNARRLLPGATVKTYPGASHAVNGERAAEVSRDVLDFVAAHEG